MNDKIELIKELKKLLIENFGDIIDRIILFGSQINGTMRESSDYDILIILKTDHNWAMESNILSVCNTINIKYDILLDVKIISCEELKTIRGKLPFILQALEQGVKV